MPLNEMKLRRIKSAIVLRAFTFALLLAPASVIAFADELEAHLVGFRSFADYQKAPLWNGAWYFMVAVALLLVMRAGAACWKHIASGYGQEHPQHRTLSPRLDLIAAGSVMLTLLLALFFGYLGLRVKGAPVPVSDVELIRERAAELRRGVGGRLPADEPLQAYSTTAFAVTTYRVSAPPQQSETNPNQWMIREVAYEEFGFPMRCLRTPIDIGLPRPSLISFFDRNADHHVLTQLTHMKLLPLNFAVNAAAFAALIWLGWSGVPSALRAHTRRQNLRCGRCVTCGYILNELLRCPECGTAVSGAQARKALDTKRSLPL